MLAIDLLWVHSSHLYNNYTINTKPKTLQTLNAELWSTPFYHFTDIILNKARKTHLTMYLHTDSEVNRWITASRLTGYQNQDLFFFLVSIRLVMFRNNGYGMTDRSLIQTRKYLVYNMTLLWLCFQRHITITTFLIQKCITHVQYNLALRHLKQTRNAWTHAFFLMPNFTLRLIIFCLWF